MHIDRQTDRYKRNEHSPTCHPTYSFTLFTVTRACVVLVITICPSASPLPTLSPRHHSIAYKISHKIINTRLTETERNVCQPHTPFWSRFCLRSRSWSLRLSRAHSLECNALFALTYFVCTSISGLTSLLCCVFNTLCYTNGVSAALLTFTYIHIVECISISERVFTFRCCGIYYGIYWLLLLFFLLRFCI